MTLYRQMRSLGRCATSAPAVRETAGCRRTEPSAPAACRWTKPYLDVRARAGHRRRIGGVLIRQHVDRLIRMCEPLPVRPPDSRTGARSNLEIAPRPSLITPPGTAHIRTIPRWVVLRNGDDRDILGGIGGAIAPPAQQPDGALRRWSDRAARLPFDAVRRPAQRLRMTFGVICPAVQDRERVRPREVNDLAAHALIQRVWKFPFKRFR